MKLRIVLLALALACAACSADDPAPTPAGIAPDASVATKPTPPERVELTEPVAPPASTPDVAATEDAPPPAKIAFEIAPYGSFEVVTWDEAARRAAAGIADDRAPAELRRLRQELLARRR